MTPPTNEHVVVLFYYRYFLQRLRCRLRRRIRTMRPPPCQHRIAEREEEQREEREERRQWSVVEATLRFFRSHASHYVPLLEHHQRNLCRKLDDYDNSGDGGVKGGIFLLWEGINGTLSCSREMLGVRSDADEGTLGILVPQVDDNGAMPSGG